MKPSTLHKPIYPLDAVHARAQVTHQLEQKKRDASLCGYPHLALHDPFAKIVSTIEVKAACAALCVGRQYMHAPFQFKWDAAGGYGLVSRITAIENIHCFADQKSSKLKKPTINTMLDKSFPKRKCQSSTTMAEAENNINNHC